MVETFLLPLGPRLVEACGIRPAMDVLDVASGTGNAAIPAAQAGASSCAKADVDHSSAERNMADSLNMN